MEPLEPARSIRAAGPDFFSFRSFFETALVPIPNQHWYQCEFEKLRAGLFRIRSGSMFCCCGDLLHGGLRPLGSRWRPLGSHLRLLRFAGHPQASHPRSKESRLTSQYSFELPTRRHRLQLVGELPSRLHFRKRFSSWRSFESVIRLPNPLGNRPASSHSVIADSFSRFCFFLSPRSFESVIRLPNARGDLGDRGVPFESVIQMVFRRSACDTVVPPRASGDLKII